MSREHQAPNQSEGGSAADVEPTVGGGGGWRWAAAAGAVCLLGAVAIGFLLDQEVKADTVYALIADALLTVAGALGAFAYTLHEKRLHEISADKEYSTIVGAMVASPGVLKKGSASRKNFKDQVDHYAVDKVRKSSLNERLTMVCGKLNSAVDRWHDAYKPLTQMRGISGARDVFFVLQADLYAAKSHADELASIVKKLEGNGDSDAPNGEQSANQGESNGGQSGNQGEGGKASKAEMALESKKAHGQAIRASRAMAAALARRDESYVLIPSLQTLYPRHKDNGAAEQGQEDDANGGADHEKVARRLRKYQNISNFWDLFDVISADMHSAHVLLHDIVEGRAKADGIVGDVVNARKHLGSCLERIRNSLLILGWPPRKNSSDGGGDNGSDKQGSTVISEEGRDPNEESSASNGGKGGNSRDEQGNTFISEKDLDALYEDAKAMESGNSEARELPSSYGVMIRDLHSALKALGGLEALRQSQREEDETAAAKDGNSTA